MKHSMLKKNVLDILTRNRGTIVTGGQLSRRFNVSRTAIWKAINALKEDGHSIDSVPNKGYCMSEFSDGLSETSILEKLTTQEIGRNIEIHQKVDSTNSYIKSLDTKIFPSGFTVIANEQTGGRGRYNRDFFSPAHEGIYMSILLKPELDLKLLPMLTVCAAVAVSQAIENICGVEVSIKWVNDIYYQGKKLCGILSEAFISAELNIAEYAVVGMGINTGKVDSAIKNIATSVCEINGMKGVRNRLAAEILNCFEDVYLTFLDETSSVLDEYERRLFIMGKTVEVVQVNETYAAKVLGIDETAGLIVEKNDGVKITVNSGEIKLLNDK